jgi:hypothetical protein
MLDGVYVDGARDCFALVELRVKPYTVGRYINFYRSSWAL